MPTRRAVAAGTVAAAVFPRSAVARPSRRSARLLIVDNSGPGDIALAQTMFLRWGYSFTYTCAGAKAVRAAERRPGGYALIICDTVLADMSGPEAVRLIRQWAGDIPALMLSRYGDKPPVPFASFLSTPCSAAELVTATARALGQV